MAEAQKTGTTMEPWKVETWTKTCGLPLLLNFEPHRSTLHTHVVLLVLVQVATGAHSFRTDAVECVCVCG